MKKRKAKSNNKPIILVNLILITILSVVAVYAWFAINADNNVKMYDIEVHSDNPLQLSFTGADNDWSESLNLNDYIYNGNRVLETMKFIEVTGDGSAFKIPTLIQYDGYALPDTSSSAVWKTAVKNENYLEFPIYMRSKDPLNVYLSSASYAEPACTHLNATGANAENKSTYGNFSKDCIVGALRVAAYASSSTTSASVTGSSKFIWITNPEFQLSNNKGSSTYTMAVGANGSTDFSWSDRRYHYYYNVSGTTSTLTTISSSSNILLGNSKYGTSSSLYGPSYAIPDTDGSKPSSTKTKLASLSGTMVNGYYRNVVIFRVWVEGCDTESRRALVGGKFNLAIMLDSFAA